MARVFVSSVINGRSDRVWARVRDFNGMPNWHPAIAESRIEGGEPSDKIGCVRDFRLRNGDRIREKLLGLSDYDMFCTYAILESPMGVENYVATLRLTPVTDGERTFAEWTAEFDCAPEREGELIANIGGERVSGWVRRAQTGVRRLEMAHVVKSTIIDASTDQVWACCATSTASIAGTLRSRPAPSSAARARIASVACAALSLPTARSCASNCSRSRTLSRASAIACSIPRSPCSTMSPTCGSCRSPMATARSGIGSRASPPGPGTRSA